MLLPRRVRPHTSEFQSLFSWNLLLMADIGIDTEDNDISFNPCFRGTCSWCSEPAHKAAVLQEFQSLFSWNLLLMCEKMLRDDLLTTCFNPCFRGTCSWCFLQAVFGYPLFGVSILVFVELALDDGSPARAWFPLSQFQSLFSWNLLLMKGAFRYRLRPRK